MSPSLSPARTVTPAAWSRPWFALLIAAGGFGVTAAALVAYSGSSLRLGSWAPWATSLLALGIVCVPLTAAVIVAGRSASTVGTARATGIDRWSVTDVALGLGLGLLLRAVTELIAPTTGALQGPLSGGDAAAARIALAISVVAVVAVSPVVEELFFRGLVLRATFTALADAGRAIATVVAVVVSTALFVALHTAAGATSTGTLVATIVIGAGCGIVTAATGRIASAIAAHALFNAVGVALLLL